MVHGGSGADYVPLVDGHLNGAKSLQSQYRLLKEQSARIAGPVPVVVFIDWPNDMMTGYLNLPLQEKKDYWRIFGAEAYANGIFPAFHLKDTVGSPTATDLGMMGFFTTYTRFFKTHRALFKNNEIGTQAVRAGAAGVAASLLVQRGTGRRTIHLVNHNYDQGIRPQSGFTVEAEAGGSCPRRLSLVSPDFPGARSPAFTCRNGTLKVTVDRQDHYTVIRL